MVPRKIDTSFNPLSALSPLDGRYRKAVQDLALFFSVRSLDEISFKGGSGIFNCSQSGKKTQRH